MTENTHGEYETGTFGPLVIPLVGAWHRPPARQILAVLPSGAKLTLVAEPDNAYDPKAIQVLVSVYEELPLVQYPALRASLEGTGTELEELTGRGDPWSTQPGPSRSLADVARLLEEPPHLTQLGYLADSDGKYAKGGPGNREAGEVMQHGRVEATLAFGADGKPQVRIVTLGPEPTAEDEAELAAEFDEEYIEEMAPDAAWEGENAP